MSFKRTDDLRFNEEIINYMDVKIPYMEVNTPYMEIIMI